LISMNYNVKYLPKGMPLAQIYLIFICLAIISCKQSKKPDVSNIKLDIKIQRFDKDLYEGKNKDIAKTNLFLHDKYGFFYDDFTQRMVGNPTLPNAAVIEGLYKSQPYADLNAEVDSVFPNLTTVEKDLTESFKYIKFYYPKAKIPRFISFISGFAYQVPVGDNYIGIGLDMFLGANSKFYDAIVASSPKYQSRRFTPAYIVPRVTEEYAKQELFEANKEDQTLLAKMIHEGKILYFLDQVLPEITGDSIKIGYTDKQITWAKQFEGNIWSLFLENDLIYQTDIQKTQTYLNDGPFTAGIGDRGYSAPKLGVFIGWQIVKKYMELNTEVTLQQLMAEPDAQKILTKAKYKPKVSE
jgi:gliding motility-associated lipoprotein GldB